MDQDPICGRANVRTQINISSQLLSPYFVMLNHDMIRKTYDDTAAADGAPLEDKDVEEGGGCRKRAEDQEPKTKAIATLLLENAIVLVGWGAHRQLK